MSTALAAGELLAELVQTDVSQAEFCRKRFELSAAHYGNLQVDRPELLKGQTVF